jgi:hypothetical protein
MYAIAVDLLAYECRRLRADRSLGIATCIGYVVLYALVIIAWPIVAAWLRDATYELTSDTAWNLPELVEQAGQAFPQVPLS